MGVEPEHGTNMTAKKMPLFGKMKTLSCPRRVLALLLALPTLAMGLGVTANVTFLPEIMTPLLQSLPPSCVPFANGVASSPGRLCVFGTVVDVAKSIRSMVEDDKAELLSAALREQRWNFDRTPSCPPRQRAPEELLSTAGRIAWRFGVFGEWVLTVGLYIDDPLQAIVAGVGTLEQEQLLVMLSILREGDVVVDVGAHVGTKAVPFAKKVGRSGHVFAFEPQPALHGLLRANSRVSGVEDQLTTYMALLSDKEAVRTRDLPILLYGNEGGESNWGATSFAASKETFFMLSTDHAPDVCSPVELLQVVALDEMEFPSCPVLVKIDAELMESRVLNGFEDGLRHCRPAIEMEAHHEESTTKAFAVLLRNNYAIYSLSTSRRMEEHLHGSRNHEGFEDGLTPDIIALPRECLHPATTQCPEHLQGRFDHLVGPSAIFPLFPIPQEDLLQWHQHNHVYLLHDYVPGYRNASLLNHLLNLPRESPLPEKVDLSKLSLALRVGK